MEEEAKGWRFWGSRKGGGVALREAIKKKIDICICIRTEGFNHYH